MISAIEAVRQVRGAQQTTGKPLAIILAGHNGSGKSTLWDTSLADELQMPLVNADRFMLSILPPSSRDSPLPHWATIIRDGDEGWMRVAQNGVQAFVGHAMNARVPFAMETVFSHWVERPQGGFESKIDLIRDLQKAGYFVFLIFVGLSNVELSILRVSTRVRQNGHGVSETKLRERFPRTQRAIGAATSVADASLLADNSLKQSRAFTVCRVVIGGRDIFDIRRVDSPAAPRAITEWLNKIHPVET